MFLLDTNIAIYLRDRDDNIVARVAELAAPPAISIITWIELENGVVRDDEHRSQRRISLDTVLETLPVFDLDDAVVWAYREIIAEVGYSRGRIMDRLIAATALAHDLVMIAINGSDFRDIPGLKLEIWPAPAQ